MFVNEGLRTISPDKQMELFRVGGSGNIKCSIIGRLADKSVVLAGPFNWTMHSRDLRPDELAGAELPKVKKCTITLFGPHKKWADLLLPGFSKQESISILSEALRVWPEIQGPEFKIRNVVKIAFAPELDDWLKRG